MHFTFGAKENDETGSMLISDRVFRPLRYRPGGIGNWSGHLPFAHDLIAHLRPKHIVELGTHYGESYFGFCQAVAENSVPATCHAIDTWTGEAHSGFYGEEVFEDVKRYNLSLYGSFSYLLRCTFAEAADRFSDHSIDLLHIDGLHTYEAVSHDFRQWLPRVRPGGCILLHDIEARHGNFGVWRLWDEITSEFPSFSFTHSWGLGVIRVPSGQRTDDTLLQYLFEGTAHCHLKLRRYYEMLAENLELKSELIAPLSAGASVQIFPPSEDGYSEATSTRVAVAIGVVQHVSCVVRQFAAVAPLRIDPCNFPAVIEIRSIALSDHSGATLWSSEHLSIGGLKVTGTAIKLPGTNNTFLYSYGEDPQILVPTGNLLSRESSVLDLTIRIDTDPAAILPFLEQFSPWKGLKLDPLLIQAAMDLFEQECADLDALTP